MRVRGRKTLFLQSCRFPLVGLHQINIVHLGSQPPIATVCGNVGIKTGFTTAVQVQRGFLQRNHVRVFRVRFLAKPVGISSSDPFQILVDRQPVLRVEHLHHFYTRGKACPGQRVHRAVVHFGQYQPKPIFITPLQPDHIEHLVAQPTVSLAGFLDIQHIPLQFGVCRTPLNQGCRTVFAAIIDDINGGLGGTLPLFRVGSRAEQGFSLFVREIRVVGIAVEQVGSLVTQCPRLQRHHGFLVEITSPFTLLSRTRREGFHHLVAQAHDIIETSVHVATGQFQGLHILIRVNVVRHNHHRPIAAHQFEIVKRFQGNHLRLPLALVLCRKVVNVIDTGNKMIAEHYLRVKISPVTPGGPPRKYIEPSIVARIQHALPAGNNLQSRGTLPINNRIPQISIGNQFIGCRHSDIIRPPVKILHIDVGTLQPLVRLVVGFKFGINRGDILLRHHVQPTVARNEQQERNK